MHPDTASDMHPSATAALAIQEEGPSPQIGELIRYWLSIHPGPHLPGRQHFEPLDIVPLLPHIVMTDIEADERRYRCRVMGTAVADAFGFDITGAFFVDALPEFRDSLGFRHRVEVETTGLPLYRNGEATMRFRLDYAPVEQLHLPLATDGHTVDKILSLTLYQQPEVAG